MCSQQAIFRRLSAVLDPGNIESCPIAINETVLLQLSANWQIMTANDIQLQDALLVVQLGVTATDPVDASADLIWLNLVRN